MDPLLCSAVCAAYIVIKRRHKRKTQRRLWIKRYLSSRSSVLRDIESGGDVLFPNFTRMSKQDFDFLLEKLRPRISRQDTVMRNAITAEIRLAITLRYLATGDSYTSLSYLFRVSKQSISMIIPETAKHIREVLNDYVKLPGTEDDWEKIADGFEKKWNFPNCIGAVDGKHVAIQCPENSGSTYFNYKGYFSIVLMAVVDDNYSFIYCSVGCQGKISDGGVFKNTAFSRKLINNNLHLPPPKLLPGRTLCVPYVLLADDAFPLSQNIMKPFPVDLEKGSPKRVYNYRLSRARRIVENAFGLMTSVFRVFRKPMELKVENVIDVTLCCVYLHNFLRKQSTSRNIYAPFGALDTEDASTGDVIPGSWRNVTCSDTGIVPVPSIPRKPPTDAKKIRDEFLEYFMTERGSVPWQDKYM